MKIFHLSWWVLPVVSVGTVAVIATDSRRNFGYAHHSREYLFTAIHLIAQRLMAGSFLWFRHSRMGAATAVRR
jgi:hypothetical protein